MISRNLFFVLTFLLMFVVGSGFGQVELKTGDILFRGKNPTKLSEAIDEVTQTGSGHHFSHVGIAEVTDGEVFVIHAEGEKGVCKESLDSFSIDEVGRSLYVEAYRLKPKYRDNIDSAIVSVNSVIGEPYNYTYIIEDKGYYCSELIYWAFQSDSVFQLNPMTFKDLETGDFHPGWIEHYNKLGIEIPEGLPGCNPNGMAASENLLLLGEIN
ncbi:hypothetical protein DDZ16_18305 [Marinilabilia rubra]|uniref:Permuted papain-like amidase YaeF/Yiix C92 family enzyme n=2 Tax=Marinilabilia rubra TaxID=2162893 RepID=A0A2U2B4B0_9BACT|nr:hypothetical protein DDZ16_18305 [Marinilabilia rubra]